MVTQRGVTWRNLAYVGLCYAVPLAVMMGIIAHSYLAVGVAVPCFLGGYWIARLT